MLAPGRKNWPKLPVGFRSESCFSESLWKRKEMRFFPARSAGSAGGQTGDFFAPTGPQPFIDLVGAPDRLLG